MEKAREVAEAAPAGEDGPYRAVRPAAVRSFRKKAAPSRSPSRERVSARGAQDRSARNPSRSRSRSRSRSPDTRRAARQAPDKQAARKAAQGPAVDSVAQGRVTSVRDFGCFMRLPGADRDGLLHISQAAGAPPSLFTAPPSSHLPPSSQPLLFTAPPTSQPHPLHTPSLFTALPSSQPPSTLLYFLSLLVIHALPCASPRAQPVSLAMCTTRYTCAPTTRYVK